MEEFSKVMQTLDYVLRLHNFLEFSHPSSCLDEAMLTRKKYSRLNVFYLFIQPGKPHKQDSRIIIIIILYVLAAFK